MAEMRRAVPHHDLRRHPQSLECFAFEPSGIERHIAGQVEPHVDQRTGQKLDGAKARVEGRSPAHPGDEVGWNGPACLRVDREAVEHLGGGQPVLEQLRGELHVVAGHAGAGERGIRHVGAEAVQRVTELVEQRRRVVPADQYGLAGWWLHEVAVVGDEGQHPAVELLLGPLVAHPRARPLAGAGEGVEVPEANGRAVAVLHHPHADVGVVHRNGPRRDRLELQPEEPPGDEEHALPQPIKLEVGSDLRLVEIELRLADLLSVKTVVPRGDRDLGPLRIGECLHVGDLFAGANYGRLPDRLHQLHRAVWGLRHRVVKPPVGMRRKPEQHRPPGPQGENLRHDGVGVGGPAVVAPSDEHPPRSLPQVPPLGVGEKGLHARTGVGHRPAARAAPRLRRVGRRSPGWGGQAIEIGFRLEDERCVVLLVKDVLREGGVEFGELLVDGGEFCLGGCIELRPGVHEAREVEPCQPPLLGAQAGGCGRLVHGGDPSKQPLVVHDPVAERRQPRRHRPLDGLEGVVAQAAGVHAVHRHHPVERPRRPLESSDRILEGGGRGIGRNRLHGRKLLLHAGLEGRREVADGHPAIRGDASIGTRPRGE